MIDLAIKFAVAHFLCDFVLQTDHMATGKSEGKFGFSWWYWLLCHACIHAGAVYLITESLLLFLLELWLHFLIDMLKPAELIDSTTDQVLHWVCKAGYLLLIWGGAAA